MLTLKENKIWFIFLPVLLICTVVRYLQIIYAIDPVTGYYNQGGVLPNLFLIVLILSIIVISGILLFDKGIKNTCRTVKLSNLSQNIPIFMGCVVLLLCSCYIYNIVNTFDIAIHNSAYKPNVILLFFQMFNLLIILIIGFRIISKGAITKNMGYLLIMPSIYYVVKVGVLFRSYFIINTISQNVYNLSYCFLEIILFVFLARLYTGVEKKNTRIILLITSFSCALFCISTTLSRITANLIGPVEVRSQIGNNAEDLIVGIFAVCIIINFFKKPKTNETE